MAIPKEYFHDRLILLLLTVNSFLAVLGSLLILLRLDPGRNEGYIVQNRTNLGINAFKIGHSSDLLAFILFLIIVLVVHTSLSIKVYPIHRQFAVTILAMGLLLISLAIIVSNALLVLR